MIFYQNIKLFVLVYVLLIQGEMKVLNSILKKKYH